MEQLIPLEDAYLNRLEDPPPRAFACEYNPVRGKTPEIHWIRPSSVDWMTERHGSPYDDRKTLCDLVVIGTARFFLKLGSAEKIREALAPDSDPMKGRSTQRHPLAKQWPPS